MSKSDRIKREYTNIVNALRDASPQKIVERILQHEVPIPGGTQSGYAMLCFLLDPTVFKERKEKHHLLIPLIELERGKTTVINFGELKNTLTNALVTNSLPESLTTPVTTQHEAIGVQNEDSDDYIVPRPAIVQTTAAQTAYIQGRFSFVNDFVIPALDILENKLQTAQHSIPLRK